MDPPTSTTTCNNQAFDDPLEELFDSKDDFIWSLLEAKPAAVAVSQLLLDVRTAIRHCTRNRHKLYRIGLRSYQVLRQVHARVAEMEALPEENADESTFIFFNSFVHAINALETCLEDLSRLLPDEAQPFPTSDLRSWFSNMPIICGVYNQLYSDPFKDPEYPGSGELQDDAFFDDCYWFLQLFHHAMDGIIAANLTDGDSMTIIQTLEKLKIAETKRTVAPSTSEFGIHFATLICELAPSPLSSERQLVWRKTASFLQALPERNNPDITVSEESLRQWHVFAKSISNDRTPNSGPGNMISRIFGANVVQGNLSQPWFRRIKFLRDSGQSSVPSGEAEVATNLDAENEDVEVPPGTDAASDSSYIRAVSQRLESLSLPEEPMYRQYREVMEANANSLATLMAMPETKMTTGESYRLNYFSESYNDERYKGKMSGDHPMAPRLAIANKIQTGLKELGTEIKARLTANSGSEGSNTDQSTSPMNYGHTSWVSAEPFMWEPRAGPSGSILINPPPYSLPLPTQLHPPPPEIQTRPLATLTPFQTAPKLPSHEKLRSPRNDILPEPQPYPLPPDPTPSPGTESPAHDVIDLGADVHPQKRLEGRDLTRQVIEQSDLPANPPKRATSPHRAYGSLDLGWTLLFNAARHRVPILPATWFQDSWELSILLSNHILFTERSEKKRRVLIYDIPKAAIHLLQVKYDAAILSGDGRCLLVGYDRFLSIINVSTEKVIKKFKTKGLHVHKWTSHNHAFCWVDNDGQFWSWKYEAGGQNSDPKFIFRLESNAPRYWMTPLVSYDGTWVGICATEKDRRQGVVQLFATDNLMVRVFEGPAAAAFTEIHTDRGMELVVMLLSVLKDAQSNCIALDAWGLDRHSTFQEHTRCDVVITPSMKLSPEIYIDKLSSLAISAVSTTATEGSIAVVFEPRTGQFITSCRLNVDHSPADKIYCGIYGIYMERDSSLFLRLTIYTDGRPEKIPTNAEEFFLPKLRRSVETLDTATIMSGSESRAGSSMTWGTDITSLSSSSLRGNERRKDFKAQHVWGRGFMANTTDESWMNQKQTQTLNRIREGDDSD